MVLRRDTVLMVVCVMSIGFAIGRVSVVSPARASVPRTSASANAFGRFAGAWYHHTGGLRIDATGHGVHQYRVYVNCTPQRLTACDKFVGNTIYGGGYEQFALKSVSGTIARGTITGSSSSWKFQAPIAITLLADGTARYATPGLTWRICRTSQPKPACGA